MLKRSIFTGMLFLGLTGLAGAADLPAPVFPTKAPLILPADLWTGCYLNGLMGTTGADGVSGGPDAGAKAECLTQRGNFVYGMGADMVFTKLSAGNLSSPLTMSMDLTVGYAFHPGLGTIAMIPLNDVLIYVSPALPASVINTAGTSQMDTGWMIKGGVATAMSYTPTGQVASTLGFEYRQAKVDNIESHTWMAVMKLRMPPLM